MPKPDASRRWFLQLTGTAASSGWLTAQWPALLALGQSACSARDQGESFQNLLPEQAADLAAVAAQIFPSDETPGADEAGVIYFIDGALDTVMRGGGDFLVDGMRELNKQSVTEFSASRFSQLPAAEQLKLLQQNDETPWFGAVRFLTVAGMFAMPVHGGNRAKTGWNLLGFDDRHGWLPPFGYYDAAETQDD